MYIIVWMPTYKEPHVSLDSHYFLEKYSTYDDAKKTAEEMLDLGSDWYNEYEIFKEVEE